jgi:hypothetical protein
LRAELLRIDAVVIPVRRLVFIVTSGFSPLQP